MRSESVPLLVEQLPVMRRSLRIAVVTETYPPEINGVSMSAARFIDGLRRRNHQIQLIRPRQDRSDKPGSDPQFSETLTRGLPIPRYPSLRVGFPAKRTLTQLWSVNRPDIVHIVTEGPLGWSALQAVTKLKLPVVSDFRTNFHAYSAHYGVGWLKKPILGYLRKFHNRTRFTLVPTETMRVELAAQGFRNLEVISRGVDTRLFDPNRRSESLRRSWGADPGDTVVLYVGRLAPEKNLTTLALAFEAMRARNARARLVLVGDGPARAELESRIPDAVFAGTRTGEDLAAHYASSDVFLFPSLTETYGNVTVEAMASGLAVVAFDYAAAREHIRDSINGLLARNRSEDFVRLAADLAPDLVRSRDLGREARVTAQSLDWDGVVQRLEGLLMGAAGVVPQGPAESGASLIIGDTP